MGMFDWIKCELELPDGASPDDFNEEGLSEFQTKDLDCFLETYTITSDGKLYRHTEQGQTACQYTGELVFYSTDTNDVWHQYRGQFKDGKLDGSLVTDEEANQRLNGTREL